MRARHHLERIAITLLAEAWAGNLSQERFAFFCFGGMLAVGGLGLVGLS